MVKEATASKPYLPRSPVLGDFATAQQSKPGVVLNYLATCAQVNLAGIDSCLVSTFITMQYPASVFPCVAPDQSLAQVTSAVQSAHAICESKGMVSPSSLISVFAQRYQQILSMNQCWMNLCDDDVHLGLESAWMKACANIDLPFPVRRVTGMFSSLMKDQVFKDSVLTCMLKHLMDAPVANFGLQTPSAMSQDSCFPPGYKQELIFCEGTVVPRFLAKCKAISDKDGVSNDNPFMSYNYNQNSNSIPDSELMSDFCDLWEQLGADGSRECLLDLCDLNTTTPTSVADPAPTTRSPSHSNTPSLSPSTKTPDKSATPSLEVSRAPSPLASPFPSLQPSELPSLEPSEKPSRFTSAAPSPSPSEELSASPSQVSSTLQSFLNLQGIVTIELNSVLSLNITINEVPPNQLDSFVAVLDMAISETIAGSDNTTIQSLDEIPVRSRRFLQGSLVVDFVVIFSRDCFYENCTPLALGLLLAAEDALDSALDDDSLSALINQFAHQLNVPSLFSAAVLDLEHLANNTSIESIEGENEPETSSSTLLHIPYFVQAIPAILFFLILV